jgi:hypothetical protein
MTTTEESKTFVTELVALYEKHRARIFPRHDSRFEYISIEVGSYSDCVWLDYRRIDGNGAEAASSLSGERR